MSASVPAPLALRPGADLRRRADLEPALPGQSTTLEAEVGPLRVYRRGPTRGAPVLLVHSVNAAASSYEMRPLYERLAAARPTYAFDLPGFAMSARPARLYTPRIMTDAVHAVAAHVRERHDGARLHTAALSLSCEFLARAATERPGDHRSLGLISPTGLDGRRLRDGPAGSTKGSRVARWIVTRPLVDDLLFGLLTRPAVVRYFLGRTFGRRDIDEGLWRYCVRSAHQPGAKHAPFSFVSGYLFSGDVWRLYQTLEHPIWMTHGVRGDFTDYRRASAFADKPNWRIRVFRTGALPHFEEPDAFAAEYEAFLAEVG